MDAGGEEARALRVAAGQLARRDLSRLRLTERLRRSGLGEEATDGAVEALVEAGYVDDLRFAASRAEQLAGRGYGDALIGDRLEREGVEPDAIRAALAGLEPESERIRSLVGGERDPRRAAAMLVRRGFSVESVEQVRERWPAPGVDGTDSAGLG